MGEIVYWIGLTGGIGTGKSTVANMLRGLGVSVLDADQLAREALELESPIYPQVISHFGETILNPDGSLNRSKLGQIVFSDPEKLRKLEGLTHPFIKSRVAEEKEKLKQLKVEFAVYDVPLLFEKKMKEQFDYVVMVTCDPKQQIARIKKRNQWSELEIQNRLKAQLPLAEKEMNSDFVIQNNDSLESLQTKVKELLTKIKSLE